MLGDICRMEESPIIFLGLTLLLLVLAVVVGAHKTLSVEELKAATEYCESQGLSVKLHPNSRVEGYIKDVSCTDSYGNLYNSRY